MSFSAQGELWSIDVGQDRFEEINVVIPGGNYGWSYQEGPAPNYSSYLEGQKPENYMGTPVEPFYFYSHSGAQICIVGGFHYQGEIFPELKGKYIFADLSGEIYALTYAGNEILSKELIAVAMGSGQGVSGLSNIAGEIYATVLGLETGATGSVLKLTIPAAGEKQSSIRVVTIEEKYSQMCSRCHGPEGVPPDLEGVQPREFANSEWQNSRTDDQLRKVILEGGPAIGLSAQMPSWESVLNEEEVLGMIKKIRSFDPAKGAK